MGVPSLKAAFPAICRGTGLRDTEQSPTRGKQKTPGNAQFMLPVERINPKARLFREQKRLPESFDSPVIYGVRVETSNPYHLLISNVYIGGRPGRLKQPFRMAASYHEKPGKVKEKPGKVKPKFLCFPHFFALLFVQNVHTNPLQSGTPREAYPKQICAARESEGESSASLPRKCSKPKSGAEKS